MLSLVITAGVFDKVPKKAVFVEVSIHEEAKLFVLSNVIEVFLQYPREADAHTPTNKEISSKKMIGDARTVPIYLICLKIYAISITSS